MTSEAALRLYDHLMANGHIGGCISRGRNFCVKKERSFIISELISAPAVAVAASEPVFRFSKNKRRIPSSGKSSDKKKGQRCAFLTKKMLFLLAANISRSFDRIAKHV